MLEAFGMKSILQCGPGPEMRPEKRLQAQLLRRMMLIDPVRAITTMKAWALFVQLASQTRTDGFETMAEYLPKRVVDAGEL